MTHDGGESLSCVVNIIPWNRVTYPSHIRMATESEALLAVNPLFSALGLSGTEVKRSLNDRRSLFDFNEMMMWIFGGCVSCLVYTCRTIVIPGGVKE